MLVMFTGIISFFFVFFLCFSYHGYSFFVCDLTLYETLHRLKWIFSLSKPVCASDLQYFFVCNIFSELYNNLKSDFVMSFTWS